MEGTFHADIEDFWRLAGPLYEADPVRHTVAVALFAAERSRPENPQYPVIHLCTLHEDGQVVGAAFRTPPWPLHIGAVPRRHIPAFAARWQPTDPELPGVSGPRPEAEAFAAAWTAMTGTRCTSVFDQMLYRLGELTPPAAVPGNARRADRTDLPLLVTYWQGFGRDAHARTAQDPDVLRTDVDRWFDLGHAIMLWEVHGEPVSMAVARNPVRGMSRIGMVYTPQPHRGNGYGSAVTATAARWARDAGAVHVVLYTDLANPVSNAIYQRIGFRPVADTVELAFTR